MEKLKRRIQINISIVMAGLALSGITAYPLLAELSVLHHHLILFPAFMRHWLENIFQALAYVSVHYPYLNYGTDWLAFAHIMLAVLFAGPLCDPIKNEWVIQFGMIACAAIIPEALIAGAIRGIPWFWQVVDCFFGFVGIIPLYRAWKAVQQLKVIPRVL